jgi:hypothetical protein
MVSVTNAHSPISPAANTTCCAGPGLRTRRPLRPRTPPDIPRPGNPTPRHPYRHHRTRCRSRHTRPAIRRRRRAARHAALPGSQSCARPNRCCAACSRPRTSPSICTTAATTSRSAPGSPPTTYPTSPARQNSSPTPCPHKNRLVRPDPGARADAAFAPAGFEPATKSFCEAVFGRLSTVLDTARDPCICLRTLANDRAILRLFGSGKGWRQSTK